MQTRFLLLSALLIAAASASSFGQSLTLGLVAHYELNGNALDSSGNGIDGSFLNSTSSTTDRFGNPTSAIYFGPSNGRLVGSGIDLANSSSSISLWVNKRYVGNGSNGTPVLGVGDVGANGQAMSIALDYGQSIRYSFWNDDFDVQTPVLPADEWHHLAFTFDNTTNERRIYADGELVAMNTSAYGFSGNTEFWFGHLDMAIDDVRFYNRVLTPTEIEMAYNVPEPSTAVFGLLSALVLAVRRNRTSLLNKGKSK